MEVKWRLQCEIRHMKNSWCEISAKIHGACDCKDSNSLYSTIRQIFGPQPSTVVPLKSKDGSVLIKDAVGIIWLHGLNTLQIYLTIPQQLMSLSLMIGTEGDLNRDDD